MPSTRGLIEGTYYESDWIEAPGVGAASAYADLDMFGVEFVITSVPEFWLLTQIDLQDTDDEGALMRVWLGNNTFGVTSSDNGALVIPDANLMSALGSPIAISGYGDANTGQIGTAANIDRWCYTPGGLYVQLQSGGVPNIAAGSVPRIRVKGLM